MLCIYMYSFVLIVKIYINIIDFYVVIVIVVMVFQGYYGECEYDVYFWGYYYGLGVVLVVGVVFGVVGIGQGFMVILV